MAPFDPVAATQAYMATLSPAAHARATAYTHGGEWLLLWSALATVVSCWIIVRTGLLRRLSDRFGGRTLAAAACAVSFAVLDFVLELPWAAYAQWWRERSYGLTSQPFRGWMRDNALQAVVGAVVTTLFLMVLYALIRWLPRAWWAVAGAVAAVFVVMFVLIGPVLIEPMFNQYTPAPPGAIRTDVVELAEKVGVPHDKIMIFNGSRQSNRYTANVAGMFGSARIAMSDVMFAKGADVAEVRGVVGHEMGHYVLNHTLWYSLFLSVVSLVGFFLADRLFGLGCRLLGAPVASIADPAGLPVLMAILTVLGLLATPLFRSATRIEETQADHFSMVHAHEPDGLSRALVKTIEYRASSPSALEEFLFYDHPSVERRVMRAMEWKAANPELVGK